ncbi:hypothetical protein HRbin09_01817 [bacterium HR09]|nr:hypothetical protein HRbin09_01817 [bacterium HR09]
MQPKEFCRGPYLGVRLPALGQWMVEFTNPGPARTGALTGLRVAGYSREVMNAMGYRSYGHWYWFHTPERR